MATFKVGMRVKVNRPDWPGHGMEGVVMAPGSLEYDWCVHLPGSDNVLRNAGRFVMAVVPDWWAFYSYQLVPLTGPDAWADQAIKSLLEKCKDPIPLPLDAIPFGD